jgi:hypothetical protein
MFDVDENVDENNSLGKDPIVSKVFNFNQELV